jgi:prepilin-type N-terminal cleavage/methylation domain-containing protein
MEGWMIGRGRFFPPPRSSTLPAFPHSKPHRGFTLLEVMIAVVILAVAMTVAWQTFTSVTRAWTGARVVMDQLHHGDFVLDRLTSSLRSMVFFGETAPEKYAFRMENNSSGYGEHTISWVTGSRALIPPGEAYAYGLRRIEIGAGADEEGSEGLVVRTWPYLADEEKIEKRGLLLSENIKGLRCRVYDTAEGEEGWKDIWEISNAVPGLIEITLYADPAKEYGDPVEFRRLIEIPLGPPVTNQVSEAR